MLWGGGGGGCISATPWVICIYEKVPSMQRIMLEFWKDLCFRQDNDLSQELHVYFRRTMPGLILSCFGIVLVNVCMFIVIYRFSYHIPSSRTLVILFHTSHIPVILPCTHVFSPVTSTSSCPGPCLFCIVYVMVRFGDWQFLGALLFVPRLLRFMPFSFT